MFFSIVLTLRGVGESGLSIWEVQLYTDDTMIPPYTIDNVFTNMKIVLDILQKYGVTHKLRYLIQGMK